MFVLKSRATFTFKGPPTCFPVRARAPAPFSIRPGMLPAHFLRLLGARRPRAGRVDQGRAGLSAARPATGARRGFRSGAGTHKGTESQTAQCPAARAQSGDHTAPLVQGGREVDNGGLSPGALSSRSCRDRHGASGGSRGAARTPGALPAPAARAGRSAALTLNSPYALWLHSTRVEKLEV